MKLKKIEKVFMSKFVGTGPSSYEKRIYWAAVSQRLSNTGVWVLNRIDYKIADVSSEHGAISGPVYLRVFDFPDEGRVLLRNISISLTVDTMLRVRRFEV